MSLLHSAGYLMLQAEEAKDVAVHMKNEEFRQGMLRIAAQYVALARFSASLTEYENVVLTYDKKPD